MKKIIEEIVDLPHWYSFGVVFLYSILIAEFFSSVNNLIPINEPIDNNILIIFSRIGYVLTVISGFIVWIISALIFHLTALLFDGSSSFKRFLFVSSCSYIIPSFLILIGLFMLDKIKFLSSFNSVTDLMGDESVKLVFNLINISALCYYIVIIIIIHFVYKIKFLHAIFSVAIPILSIWALIQLFTLIF